MTRHLILISTILITACGQHSQVGSTQTNKSALSVDSLQTFTINKTTADDFQKAKKTFIDKTLFDTTAFKKVNYQSTTNSIRL